nr:insulinase family protein [uncultured Desulfobulbus sp.]
MRYSLWQRGVLFLFLFLLPCFSLTGNVAEADTAQAQSCLSVGWPHESSDLKPDPGLVFGRLANGLRYVLKTNATPKNRVAMYLNVQSGSLHETEQQRGLAHFLEHMLFNGTTHYPPGTLVEYFQSLGMEFGGDTNARTGYDETVYNLLLPSNENTVIADGFRVLADYAREALLLDSEVNRERGVILAEKRTRDSAASRVANRQMQFDFAGTLLAERDPIGLEAVIKGADSRLLRSYYDRWYRPENIIVVVVGDFTPQAVEPLLAQIFTPLQGKGEVGTCPEYGKVKEHGTDILVFAEEELGYTGLALSTVFNQDPVKDTQAWETNRLKRYLAVHLLSNRLKQLEEQPDSPLAQSVAHGGLFMGRYGYASLSGRAVAGRWQEGMELLQRTLAQALGDGFGADELARGKREIHALLEKAVQTSATRDSRKLAGEIIGKLNDREVPLSPEQEMDLYGPILDATTVADVNQAMRDLWSARRRLVEVVGRVPQELQGKGGEARVRESFAHAEAVPVPAWVGKERVSFPYLQPPAEPGKVVSSQQYPEIGVETYQLAGGVRLNIKKTGYQANQVLVAVQFGRGKQTEPAPGMAMLAQAVVSESGIGRLSNEQLEASLAGVNAELGFRIEPESFSFFGSSLASEFELMLQLLYHHLHDPAFDEEAFNRSRESLHRMYRQLDNTVEGAQQIRGERFLAGYCPEYTLASWKEVSAVQLAQIRAWLGPVLVREPLEINVVGDIDPHRVMQLVCRYFGHEERRESTAATREVHSFPAGQEQRLQVESSINKAMLTLAWKTDDFWDIGRTRRLNLLAAVLEDRLRVKIREELGATYSPQVISQPSRSITGFGLMRSALIVAPDQARSLAQVIQEVAEGLGKAGVSEDALHRAQEPMLTSIKDSKQDNRYWMESVLKLSSRHPRQLQWPLSIMEEFRAITADELTALAQQYLRPEQAAIVIVNPKAGGAVPSSTGQQQPAGGR